MGRGLSALLQTNSATSSQDAGAKEVVSGVFEVAVADIEANPKQPRVHFEPEHLQELAASISALGIVQPLTVAVFALANTKSSPVNADSARPS